MLTEYDSEFLDNLMYSEDPITVNLDDLFLPDTIPEDLECCWLDDFLAEDNSLGDCRFLNQENLEDPWSIHNFK